MVDEAESCAGGLKAQLVQGQRIVYKSVTVPPGRASSEHSYSEFNNGFGVETLRLTVRTFCYGPQGEEVGYAETTSTFSNGDGSLAAVMPRESPYTVGCSSDKASGKAPCIILF